MRSARNDRSFRIPRPQRDRVNYRQLAAIAGCCLSVGVALSGALRAPRHDRASAGLHESAEQDTYWQEATATSFAAEPAAQTLSALVVETETSISAALSPPSAAAPASPSAEPARDHTSSSEPVTPPFNVALQRGAVSYRCDASALPGAKRSKCPRDRALEARVWRVLSRLTSCRDAASTLGRAQLRLRFAPEAATSASLSAPAIAQSLNLRAVSRCVAAELSTLRSTRKVDRFELTIGFALSGRN